MSSAAHFRADASAVVASRARVEAALADGHAHYGINTGFGALANRRVPDDQLVTLQRTADNKHLRLDIDPAGVELAAGFPKTREELFAYRGLMLGSIEASAFTADQLRMIAEFVDVRGGGLLLLGGPRAFAEKRKPDFKKR